MNIFEITVIIIYLIMAVNLKHHYDNVISFGLFYHTFKIKRGGKIIADRIKSLREQQNKTQSDLAKQLGITRSSVNAWEMGISVPSTQYIVELAHIFNVSTDYLLGVKNTATISVAGLNDKDVELINNIILHLKQR